MQPGQAFAGYVIERNLGRGGSATVYLAHQASDPAVLRAVKVLPEEHRGPIELGRLQREYDFAQELAHPHIIEVSERGTYWLAMQYIDGGNSTSLHTLENRLTALAQIADALDFIHQRGIVHCDVKPPNILVFNDFSRGAILIDFGVAHAVAAHHGPRSTHVEASLPYAAPELLAGKPPRAATDEYALACTAVELITGSAPFTAKTSMALVDAQLHRPPPAVSHRISWIPRAFDSILAKAMTKDPELRYETCSEFIRLVTRALR